MNAAHVEAAKLLEERLAYPVGSPDWNYRTRAAWQLDQMARGIPACDWTETPPSIEGMKNAA